MLQPLLQHSALSTVWLHACSRHIRVCSTARCLLACRQSCHGRLAGKVAEQEGGYIAVCVTKYPVPGLRWSTQWHPHHDCGFAALACILHHPQEKVTQKCADKPKDWEVTTQVQLDSYLSVLADTEQYKFKYRPLRVMHTK
jgi:hypothetical protein